jgi:uncharacterized RDD family membrane protein YckC
MPRCPKCGANNDSNNAYCWKCGARLPAEYRVDGLDALLGDFRLQSLWALRLFAYIIDLIIVGLLSSLLSVFAYLPLLISSLFGGNWTWKGIWALPLYLGLTQVVYSVILEWIYGATFGKQILGLMVLSRNSGKPGLYGVFIRNLSKTHWVLLVIDFLGGVFTTHVPRDKYLDKISGTYVTYSGKGLNIPFIPRPRVIESESREIIRLDDMRKFDPFSILNFGVFLVVSATILMNTPTTIGAFIGWIASIPEAGLTTPPTVLLQAAYWFYMAIGIWGVASGALRYLLRVYPLKAVQEVFNGVFGLVLAVFIRFYMQGVFNLTYFIGSVIVFFIAQIVFRLFYRRYSE